jgi:hypothetical protein
MYLLLTSWAVVEGAAFETSKPMFAVVRPISGEPLPRIWLDLQHEFASVMDSLRCLFSWSSFVLHLPKGKRRSATLPTQDSMPP